MGGCATKPKVLNDGVQKPLAPPPEEEKVVVQEVEVVVQEVEKDVPLPTFEESPTKNPSLGNLFNKESEAVKASISQPVSQDSSKSTEELEEQQSTKVPEALHNKETTEDSANAIALVTVSNSPAEKEALKDLEFVHVKYKDASDKAQAPKAEEEEAVIVQEIVSMEITESLEKNNLGEEVKTAHDDIKKIKETVEEKVALSDQNMEAYVENKLEEVTETSSENPESHEIKTTAEEIEASEEKLKVVAEETDLTQLIHLKVQSGDETSVRDESMGLNQKNE